MRTTIKLIASDLDGTLLNGNHQIPPQTAAAVRRARQAGVRFMIVTGRMYQSALPFARELGLNDVPMITYNGGLVRDPEYGPTIYHQPLPLELCRKVAVWCEERGLHLQAYVDDELYVPDMGPATRAYVSVASVKAYPVGRLSTWLSAPSTKLLVVADPERAVEVEADLQALLGNAANVARSISTFVEIMNPRCSKGVALAAAAAALGFRREEVMAIGDAGNDISMLKWAGTSFAVCHATEDVKRSATHVTAAGPGDAVAEALERLGLA